MATLAIRSATLWDGTHADPRPGTTVVMRDGDVTWVGPDGAPSAPLADAQVIDADGRWLLPGLIDLHVHLTFDPRDPDFLRVATQLPVAEAALRGAHHARLMLEAGFTGVRDLGAFGDANVAIKRALDNGWVRGPRLATCGVFITVRGGHADLALRREVAIDQGIAVSGVEGVREAVRSRAHRGADWIKVLATAGVMTGGGAPMGACLWEDDELVAAVQASTRLGRRVAAHAHGADGIVAAANAGVATIEHVTMADTRAIDAMAHHGTALIPTFSAAEAVYREAQAGRLSPSSAAFAMTIGPRHRESFKLALDAGVTIGFGTDIGVPGTTFGDNAAEFQTMVAAGMAPAAALRAATSGAATILGWPKAGIVAPGYWGDAVLVDGDPLADVGILANRARVHAVIKGGVLEVDRRPES